MSERVSTEGNTKREVSCGGTQELEPCGECGCMVEPEIIRSGSGDGLLCPSCAWIGDYGWEDVVDRWNERCRALRQYRDPDTVAVPREVLAALVYAGELRNAAHESDVAAAAALLDQETDG